MWPRSLSLALGPVSSHWVGLAETSADCIRQLLGGIKSNIAPLIADQYQRRKMAIKVQKSGERTIIDPAITYQRIYMIFYWYVS